MVHDFVSVENWAPTIDVKNLKEPDEQECSSHEDSNNTDMEPENDIPIENLRKQLGFAKRSDFCSSRFKFPLLRNICRKNSVGQPQRS